MTETQFIHEKWQRSIYKKRKAEICRELQSLTPSRLTSSLSSSFTVFLLVSARLSLLFGEKGGWCSARLSVFSLAPLQSLLLPRSSFPTKSLSPLQYVLTCFSESAHHQPPRRENDTATTDELALGFLQTAQNTYTDSFMSQLWLTVTVNSCDTRCALCRYFIYSISCNFHWL